VWTFWSASKANAKLPVGTASALKHAIRSKRSTVATSLVQAPFGQGRWTVDIRQLQVTYGPRLEKNVPVFARRRM